jgi:rhodanese-related sulfurtransferase
MRSKGDLGPLNLGDQIEMPARSEQNALDQPLGVHRAVGRQSRKTVGGARFAGGNPGDIVSQNIETADFDGALKLLQPPRQ